MFSTQPSSILKKFAIAGALAFGALGLAGCSTAGSEAGVDVEDLVEDNAADTDPYDGRFDDEFYEDYDSYVGETVTVSADVNEIVSPTSFTIAGTDETVVDQLLIVHDGSVTEIEEGLTVKVTGIVHQTFDLPTVEGEMELELDDDLYADWDGVRYIEATNVDTSVAVDG